MGAQKKVALTRFAYACCVLESQFVGALYASLCVCVCV